MILIAVLEDIFYKFSGGGTGAPRFMGIPYPQTQRSWGAGTTCSSKGPTNSLSGPGLCIYTGKSFVAVVSDIKKTKTHFGFSAVLFFLQPNVPFFFSDMTETLVSLCYLDLSLIHI